MQRDIPLQILGVGRHLPERVVTNEELAALCHIEPAVIERSRAGVHTRRWAESGAHSMTLAAIAAREAIADAGIDVEEIDLILNASGTPQQAIPDGAPFVQRELGLNAKGTPCMSVHTTCLGFMHALDVASAFIATARYRTILIVNSEIASIGLDFDDPHSAVLFGDAATAVIVRAPEDPDSPSRLEKIHFETYGEGADDTAIRAGGSARPVHHEGFDPRDALFFMDAPKVFALGLAKFPSFLRRFGAEDVLDARSRVDWVIPHQASGKAIKVLTRMGVPEEKIVMTLGHLGNCISASIPASLYEAVRDGRLQRGQRVLIIGTGAGLTLGALTLIY